MTIVCNNDDYDKVDHHHQQQHHDDVSRRHSFTSPWPSPHTSRIILMTVMTTMMAMIRLLLFHPEVLMMRLRRIKILSCHLKKHPVTNRFHLFAPPQDSAVVYILWHHQKKMRKTSLDHPLLIVIIGIILSHVSVCLKLISVKKYLIPV